MELSFEKISNVFLLVFEMKFSMSSKEIALFLERAFIFKIFSNDYPIFFVILAEFSFKSKEGWYLFALPMHFTIVELTNIVMIIGENHYSLNVRNIVLKISIVSFFVLCFQLSITLL